MSNDYNIISCCLCDTVIGFDFKDKPSKDNYCYECGHAILLIKHAFSEINFNKIPDTTSWQDSQGRRNQTATLHYLYLLNKDK